MNYPAFILAGIRNKPGRNLATGFCFAFIAASIFSGQYLLSGVAWSLDQGMNRMGADLIVVPAEYHVFSRGSGPINTFAIIRVDASDFRIPGNVMEKIGQIQGIGKISPQLYVATLNEPELSSSPVDVFGIDSSSDFTIRPWLETPQIRPLEPGEIYVGHEIAANTGSEILLGGHQYIIAGRLDPTLSPIDHTLFMNIDDAYTFAAQADVQGSDYRIPPGNVNAVLIRVAPGEDPNIVAARIRRVFPQTYIGVIARHFSLGPASSQVAELPPLINGISMVVIFASLPLIAVIAAMVAHERQREIGLLKAMGANRIAVVFIIMAESLVLAVAGGIAGVAASGLAIAVLNTLGLLNSALQVSFRMPSPADTGMMAGLALAVVIAIAGIASIFPAYRCGLMDPYEAIRNGGQ